MQRTDLPSSDGLIPRLQEIFQDVKLYKRLVRCQGPSVQKVLDSFQQLLDTPRLDSSFRRRLIVATQRISNRSGLYPTCYDLKDIRIEGQHPISAGGFADIFKGDFEGQPVCLKAIRLYQNRDIEHFLKQFSKEAVLWCQLSHPNLLPIYGLFRFQHRPCFVSPWMSAGDITQYLKHHSQAARLPLAMDVAEGLSYLHKHGIIHGDLKGSNILVNDAGIAYVADFGLSSVSDSEIPVWTSHSSAASTGGSTRWQAPELFDMENDTNVKNTTASDVYAWSFVCYEAFTGEIPFSNIERDATVMLQVKFGARPARPADSSPPWRDWGLNETIWLIMEGCWSEDPLQRPAIEHVISLLKPQLPTDDRLRQHGAVLSPMRFRQTMGGHFDMITTSDLDILLENPAPNDPIARVGTIDLSEDFDTAENIFEICPSRFENVPKIPAQDAPLNPSWQSDVTSTPSTSESSIPTPASSPESHGDTSPQTPSGTIWHPVLALKPDESYSSASAPHLPVTEYRSPSPFERSGASRARGRKSWTGKGLLHKHDIFMKDGRNTDIVIPVMGPPGVGKSTFIDALLSGMGSARKLVGHSLRSHTETIEHFAIRHPRDNSRRLVFVDIPGFHDGYVDDSETLRRIAVWLAKSYSDNMKLAGAVYLHEISQPRIMGVPRKNLEMFRRLCGSKAFRNVVLVTTKWDEVLPEVGNKREQQLKEKYWEHILKLNSTMLRFEGSADSAWKIVNHILDRPSIDSLLVQEELVDLERTLSETEAGRTLRATLQELLVAQEKMLARLQERRKSGMGNERLQKTFEENQKESESLVRQIEELKIPLTRRVLSFLTLH